MKIKEKNILKTSKRTQVKDSNLNLYAIKKRNLQETSI